MSSVDDRIVNLQFNNSQFQTGASDSMRSLQTLEQTIGGMGSSTGLTTMGANVDGISAKFSALQVAGVTALATIVNKAVNAGLSLVKSMTLDPLIAGFKEYETNLNSIQTIMANTGAKIPEVGKYLDELNAYSDRTIYSFSEMASAIGKFTAAGVELAPATSAIKGLANAAALSGSNVQQLNTAMYQMSQALGTGVIRLMDWNSLANAGMGGENIRNALMATNRTLGDNGAAMDAAIAQYGDFRTSLTAGWLTTKTFTKTMKVFAGTTNEAGDTVAYTVKQLEKMGYTTDAAKELNKISQAAIESATKVKTFTQLIDVVKESIGSGWAKVFENLFGNFTQATKLWTGVSTSITDTVANIFAGVNNMLEGWRKLGGYQELWDGFGNIFAALGNLIEPFIAAFRALSPTTDQAGSALYKLTHGFYVFTEWLVKITDGLSIFTPIITIVFGVFKQLASIAGVVFQALSPLLDLFGQLATKAGTLASKGAEIAQGLINGILQGFDISALKSAVENIATSIVDWIKGVLGINSPAAALIPVGTAIVQGIVQGIIGALKAIGQVMAYIGKAVMNGLKTLFGGMDAIDWTVMFNAILTGGLLIMVTRFVKTLNSVASNFKGFADDVRAPFQQLFSTLKTWQQELKVKMIMDIAISVGILAGALVLLSLIGPEKLTRGIGGLAAVMALMVTSLATLSKVNPESLVSMAFSIQLLAGAVLTVTIAIAALGALPLDVLAQGLGGMAIALAIMVTALQSMTGLGTGLPYAASAILIMAVAMNALATAMYIIGQLNLDQIATSLGAMALGLNMFIGSLQMLTPLGPGITVAAAALLIVSSAMAVFAGAMYVLAQLGVMQIAVSLAAMGVALYGMVLALGFVTAMGPTVIVSAQSILLMATAMLILASAVGAMGQLSGGELAKGLLGLALALGILLAAAFGAQLVAPGLAILGATFIAIGAGVALLGLGLMAAATAFAIFAAVGLAGVGVLIAGFTAFMAILPQLAVQLATAFVMFIKTIAAAAPELSKAFLIIFNSILDTIIKAMPKIVELFNAILGAIIEVIITNAPKIGKAFTVIVKVALKAIRDLVPEFVDTGMQIIISFLAGIAKRIKEVVKAGTDIIVNFIEGIGQSMWKIVKAAGDTMLRFLQRVNNWLKNNHEEFVTTGKDIAGYIIEGLTLGLVKKENLDGLFDAIKNVVKGIVGGFTLGLVMGSPSKLSYYWGQMIVQGLANGISSSIETAVGATVAFANAVIAAGSKAIAKFQKEAAKKQIAADRAGAKAKIADQFAKEAERLAKQNPKNKAMEKAAAYARKIADKQAKAATAAQKKADAAAGRVTSAKEFASADQQGKGDILTARATALSDRAVKALALANAEALAAKKLRGKERDDMLKAARADAKAAKALADKSKKAQKAASDHYAQSVKDRIKSIRDTQKAEEQATADEKTFESATDAQKAAILQQRAEANQKKADLKQKQAEDLLKIARKLAKKDAAKAQRLIDRAERLAQEAKDAADQAKQEQEDAKSLTGSSSSSSGDTSLQLSRSAMEDAASAIDRYTKSLQQAEEAAGAKTPIYQFVQNNSSPESLTDTEIYRQTKNLLSTVAVKMGVMGVNTP